MLASIEALLSSLVDYAGLFPPAKLNLREAMTNFARNQITRYRWMLGRFVVPASGLDELGELLPVFPLKLWSLSVILSGDLELEIERVCSLDNDQIAIALCIVKDGSRLIQKIVTIDDVIF